MASGGFSLFFAPSGWKIAGSAAEFLLRVKRIWRGGLLVPLSIRTIPQRQVSFSTQLWCSDQRAAPLVLLTTLTF